MKTKVAYLAIFLWVLTISVLAFFFIRGSTEKSSDQRLAVKLSAVERDMVLGEMRTILSAVHGVVVALGAHNLPKAAAAAKTAGMGMAVDVSPTLMAKLPLEFKTLGMSLHGDFDQLAKDIEGGLTEEKALIRMGTITNKCIACHSAYRFSAGGE